jgi:hypothetical protein
MILRIYPRTSMEGLRKIYTYVWLNPKGCNDNLPWTYPVSNIQILKEIWKVEHENG